MNIKTLISVAFSRGTGIAFNLIFTLYIAKSLGSKETGIIFFSITLITAASLVSRFGFDHLMIKLISPLWEEYEHTKIIMYIHQAVIVIGVVSVFAYAFLFIILTQLRNYSLISIELYDVAFSSLVYIFPLGTLWVFSATLKAIKSPNISGFIESGAIPFLTLVFIFIRDLQGHTSNSYDIVMFYGFATMVTVCISYFIILRKNNFKYHKNTSFKPNLFSMESIKPSLNIVLMSISNYFLVWLPVLYLTILVSEETAGIYATLQRISMLISFILIIFNSILAPKFSVLFNQNKHRQIETMAKRGIKSMLLIATPIILIMFGLADFILTILGNDFIGNAMAFRLLITAQFINVFFGPVVYLLTMSSNESSISKITLILAAVAAIHTFILVIGLDLTGACISTLINLSLLNYMANKAVKNQTGISINLLDKSNEK